MDEIHLGLELFDRHGIKCEHYSYPYGNANSETDERLLKIFKTLRVGGKSLYTEDELKSGTVFQSKNFGKQPDQAYCGHEHLIEAVKQKNVAVFLYMHEPVIHRLEYLFQEGKAREINFVGMGEIK